MFKQISKIKSGLLKLLEEELMTVLAISFIAMGMFLVKADTTTTELSLVILDDGTLTVTSPNGAENWEVDSLSNITWTSTGSVASVKIELQRTVGGTWETVVASTVNDGSYLWPVTAPTTTTATIKISSVTAPAITDSSNAVFIISEVAGTPGGYVPVYPDIWSVTPLTFSYKDEVDLVIRGTGFENYAKVTLNQVVFPSQQPHNLTWMLVKLSPNVLAIGTYRLCVANTDIRYDCFPHLITVTDGTKIVPPTTGGAEDIYLAELVKQSSINFTMKPRTTAVVWAEFKNTGTATWYQDMPNPVRLGTDNKRDRRTGFYHSSWIKFNRPAMVNKVVKPGEIGRFEFTVLSPWTARTYTEYFLPVAEWKTWIGGKSQVQWVITVEKQSFWKTLFQKPTAPTTIKPAAPSTPSTGGKIEPFFQPQDTLLFTDNIERIYQKVTRVISSFLSNLRDRK